MSGNGAPLSRAGSAGVTEAARYRNALEGTAVRLLMASVPITRRETFSGGRRIAVNYQVEYRRRVRQKQVRKLDEQKARS